MHNKLAAVLLITFAIAITGCTSRNDKQSALVADSAVTVTVATAAGGLENNAITGTGQVEAVQMANISTRVMGYITGVYVKAGDRVTQGQLLFKVSSNDIQAKQGQADAGIAQAEAMLASAQKDYDRFTALYKQQSATAKELDNVTQQYNMAKAAAEAAKQMRNEVAAQKQYTSVVAPFSGIVTQKLLDAGNIATPGMPVLTLQQGSNLQVTATIPETVIAGVKNGQDATVYIGAVNRYVTGKVSQLIPSSQFTGGQYVIKIALPTDAQKGLYAGMYVNVSLALQKGLVKADSSLAIMVPAPSLIHKDELDGLYTVSAASQAVLRWVRLGKTQGDKVEVLSGLDRNEKFITSSSARLYNGVAVIVK